MPNDRKKLRRPSDLHANSSLTCVDSIYNLRPEYPTIYKIVKLMLFVGQKSEDDTVVEILASAIRRDISFGVLRPDQKLKILGLRQSYGGSNHSMRENVTHACSEGMVEATNQRGYRVTSATEDDLRDILLLRLEVEKFALKRSLEFGDVMWNHGLWRLYTP